MPNIYFDIDGTLIDSNKTLPDGSTNTAIMPAWNRLSYAVNELFKGRMPPDFDWTKHKGSTDLGVVSSIVAALLPDKWEYEQHVACKEIMNCMDEYYCREAKQGLEHLVFPGTHVGLERLTRLGRLGIVTGNTHTVTAHKLRAAGLLQYFQDRSLWFTGEMKRTRAALMEKAFLENPECKPNPYADYYAGYGAFGSPEHASLVYFGDALGDVKAMDDFFNKFLERDERSDARLLMRISPELQMPRMEGINPYSRNRLNVAAFRRLDSGMIEKFVTLPFDDLTRFVEDNKVGYIEGRRQFGILDPTLLAQSGIEYWRRGTERR